MKYVLIACEESQRAQAVERQQSARVGRQITRADDVRQRTSVGD